MSSCKATRARRSSFPHCVARVRSLASTSQPTGKRPGPGLLPSTPFAIGPKHPPLARNFMQVPTVQGVYAASGQDIQEAAGSGQEARDRLHLQ